jgi:hypothetical protein
MCISAGGSCKAQTFYAASLFGSSSPPPPSSQMGHFKKGGKPHSSLVFSLAREKLGTRAAIQYRLQRSKARKKTLASSQMRGGKGCGIIVFPLQATFNSCCCDKEFCFTWCDGNHQWRELATCLERTLLYGKQHILPESWISFTYFLKTSLKRQIHYWLAHNMPSSVPDQWYFATDLDPDPRIRTSN